MVLETVAVCNIVLVCVFIRVCVFCACVSVLCVCVCLSECVCVCTGNKKKRYLNDLIEQFILYSVYNTQYIQQNIQFQAKRPYISDVSFYLYGKSQKNSSMNNEHCPYICTYIRKTNSDRFPTFHRNSKYLQRK